MSDDRNFLAKQQLLDELWEELGSLSGEELDAYLNSIGLSPSILLQDYAKALDGAHMARQRVRFEEARRQVHKKDRADSAKILAFDVTKKREILGAIIDHANRTNEMTIAARNQKIESEGDLDSFLEACMTLGLIDSDGNLKE